MGWFGLVGEGRLIAEIHAARKAAYSEGWWEGWDVAVKHLSNLACNPVLRSENPRPEKASDITYVQCPSEIIEHARFALNSLSRKDSLMAKGKAKYFVIGSNQMHIGLAAFRDFDSHIGARDTAEQSAKVSPGKRFNVVKIVGHAEVENPAIWTDYE